MPSRLPWTRLLPIAVVSLAGLSACASSRSNVAPQPSGPAIYAPGSESPVTPPPAVPAPAEKPAPTDTQPGASGPALTPPGSPSAATRNDGDPSTAESYAPSPGMSHWPPGQVTMQRPPAAPRAPRAPAVESNRDQPSPQRPAAEPDRLNQHIGPPDRGNFPDIPPRLQPGQQSFPSQPEQAKPGDQAGDHPAARQQQAPLSPLAKLRMRLYSWTHPSKPAPKPASDSQTKPPQPPQSASGERMPLPMAGADHGSGVGVASHGLFSAEPEAQSSLLPAGAATQKPSAPVAAQSNEPKAAARDDNPRSSSSADEVEQWPYSPPNAAAKSDRATAQPSSTDDFEPVSVEDYGAAVAKMNDASSALPQFEAAPAIQKAQSPPAATGAAAGSEFHAPNSPLNAPPNPPSRVDFSPSNPGAGNVGVAPRMESFWVLGLGYQRPGNVGPSGSATMLQYFADVEHLPAAQPSQAQAAEVESPRTGTLPSVENASPSPEFFLVPSIALRHPATQPVRLDVGVYLSGMSQQPQQPPSANSTPVATQYASPAPMPASPPVGGRYAQPAWLQFTPPGGN